MDISNIIIVISLCGTIIFLFQFLKEKSLSALKWFMFSVALLGSVISITNWISETFGLGEQWTLKQVLDMIINAIQKIGSFVRTWLEKWFGSAMIWLGNLFC